jgi:hypothetical protein
MQVGATPSRLASVEANPQPNCGRLDRNKRPIGPSDRIVTSLSRTPPRCRLVGSRMPGTQLRLNDSVFPGGKRRWQNEAQVR